MITITRRIDRSSLKYETQGDIDRALTILGRPTYVVKIAVMTNLAEGMKSVRLHVYHGSGDPPVFVLVVDSPIITPSQYGFSYEVHQPVQKLKSFDGPGWRWQCEPTPCTCPECRHSTTLALCDEAAEDYRDEDAWPKYICPACKTRLDDEFDMQNEKVEDVLIELGLNMDGSKKG